MQQNLKILDPVNMDAKPEDHLYIKICGIQGVPNRSGIP